MEKLKKNRVAKKKCSGRAIARECSSGGRSETTGEGFVKQIGFKPGVKERGSYG